MTIFPLFQISIAAAIISFIISMVIVSSQKWHGKHTHDYDFDGVQKFHTEAVPRIGGIAVFLAVAFSLSLIAFFFQGRMETHHKASAIILLIISLPAFIGGVIEDVTKKVSVKMRLAAIFTSALIASAFLGATVNHLNIWGIDSLLGLPPIAIVITAIFVAGGTNAINIIDGFNGLSAGVVCLISAGLGFIAWHSGDLFVTMLSLLIVGASIGFLLVNYPTGKLFLGDGGAYFLGFWLSETAVLLLARNPSVNAWQVLAVCAYPVIEVLYSIYRRKIIRKSSPGHPDGLHLHTLVYRRVVKKLVSPSAKMPWIRNAAVGFIIAPVIGVVVFLSVIEGVTVTGGMLMVIAQVLLYIVIYTRLVRGRWIRPQGKPTAIGIDAKGDLV